MYILGVDFETTGLMESQDVVTEVGAVLWDWEGKKPVMIMDELISLPDNVKLNPVVVEMNGITEGLLDEFGVAPGEALDKLNKMSLKTDYVMAHNAEFDRKFYESTINRIGSENVFSEKIWLDSSVDVAYPAGIKTRKLVFLAAEHGFLNPFAHRALFDVLTMFSVVKDYDIKKIIKLATEQKYELKANVSYDNRRKASQRNFRWDGENKTWVKTVRESGIKKEIRSCDFELLCRKKGIEKDWKKVE